MLCSRVKLSVKICRVYLNLSDFRLDIGETSAAAYSVRENVE